MTDGPLLLAAIRADPADDTVRLAYADWLQENAREARAEFIRVQIELARMDAAAIGPAGPVPRDSPYRASDERLQYLVSREDAIFYDVEHDLGSVPKGWNVYRRLPEKAEGRSSFDEYPPRSAFFDRGFLHSVKAPTADWLANAHALLAKHPVRRVRLTTTPPDDDRWELANRMFGTEAFTRLGYTWEEWVVFWQEARDDPLRISQALSVQWPGVEFDLPP